MNKKIILFVTLTYLLSWSVALSMFLFQIPYGSLLSYILIAGLYMTSPALVTIFLQKVIYKQRLSHYGFSRSGLKPKHLLLPFFLLWAVIGVYFLLTYVTGNLLHVPLFGVVDFSNNSFMQQLEELLQNQALSSSSQPIPPLPFHPFILFFIILTQGSLLGSIANFPFALGEELGWRGLLQSETKHFGFYKSNVFIGIIWGLWHAPIILLGHNYPGFPISGMFMMILFCIALSFLLGYIRVKTKSIIGPTLFHGGLNAVAVGVSLFVRDSHLLIGSLAGIIGIVAIGVSVFFLRRIKHFHLIT